MLTATNYSADMDADGQHSLLATPRLIPYPDRQRFHRHDCATSSPIGTHEGRGTASVKDAKRMYRIRRDLPCLVRARILKRMTRILAFGQKT
jgi:hypothetical protein